MRGRAETPQGFHYRLKLIGHEDEALLRVYNARIIKA
jgi:hypothetical protein